MVDHIEWQPALRRAMQAIPPGQQEAQGKVRRHRLGQHRFGERRRQKTHRDAFGSQPFEDVERGLGGGWQDVDACTSGQVRPELPPGRVERRTRDQRSPVFGRDLVFAKVPDDEIGQ